MKITLGSFRISPVTGTAGGVDTSGKFATSYVNDLEGKNLSI